MTFRLFPPADRSAQFVSINSRLYAARAGSYVDAPASDAVELVLAGWSLAGPVGPTHDRPRDAHPGMVFFDQTLGRAVVWDGRTWRDPFSGEPA
jgi:hypothetical protein